MTTLRKLIEEAGNAEWRWIPPSPGGRYGSITNRIGGVECRLDKYGPLIVYLHNHASAFAELAEAGKEISDNPDHGYEKGLWITRDRIERLRAALRRVEEG